MHAALEETLLSVWQQAMVNQELDTLNERRSNADLGTHGS
jgi:hypothetical protein